MTEDENCPEAMQVAIERLRSGGDANHVIRAMRDAGLSVTDCIDALCESGRYMSDEAKEMVVKSPAWADRKDMHDRFHEALIREITDEL